MNLNHADMILRAAKASLRTGGHVPEPASRAQFAMGCMERSLGTITGAEVDALYAEEQATWAAIKALPGVEITDHGCAYMPEHATADRDPHDGPDLHATDAAEPSMPNTVADLLNMANTTEPEPQPVFQMAILEVGNDGEHTAYAQEMAFLEGAPPVHIIAAMLRGAADAMERKGANNDH